MRVELVETAVNGLEPPPRGLQGREVEARGAFLRSLGANRQVAVPRDGLAVQGHQPAAYALLPELPEDKLLPQLQVVRDDHVAQEKLQRPGEALVVGEAGQRRSQVGTVAQGLLELPVGWGHSEAVEGQKGQRVEHALLEVPHAVSGALRGVCDDRVHGAPERYVHRDPEAALRRRAELQDPAVYARDQLREVSGDLGEAALVLDLPLSRGDVLDLPMDLLPLVVQLLPLLALALAVPQDLFQLRGRCLRLANGPLVHRSRLRLSLHQVVDLPPQAATTGRGVTTLGEQPRPAVHSFA
mmetsp:Transcript_118109/g.381199  ORF Transcript_118109/g.381199 Transcript_118109/m.381199 type:complete len:298 (-) Transcript_118109:280-1173(-)